MWLIARDILLAISTPRLLIAYWLCALGSHPLLIALFALAGLVELMNTAPHPYQDRGLDSQGSPNEQHHQQDQEAPRPRR